jgi:aminoglycoside phosphotransferase (APT) family kinase protein
MDVADTKRYEKSAQTIKHNNRKEHLYHMDVIDYNLQFERLCNELQLGKIIGTSIPISGGLLHKMFAVETSTGSYAIKALNPKIMARPTAIQNFKKSEGIANIASRFLPAHPAIIMNETSLHKIGDQNYLVFNWIHGVSLKSDEITIDHCKTMGSILSDLHSIDFSEMESNGPSKNEVQVIDWAFYMKVGELNNAEWVHLMHESIDLLYDWNSRANKATEQLASLTVISHRDLEPKNVMWVGDRPIIIDWESAGEVNPMHDLIDSAIYWSSIDMNKIDKERFFAFINGYKKRYKTFNTDWDLVLDNGFLGKLGWLEYSLKRSLWIECTNEEEQQLGTKHVTGTINVMKRYAELISELKKWLTQEIS